MDIKFLLNEDKDVASKLDKATEKMKKTKKAIEFCRPCNTEYTYKQNYKRHLNKVHASELRFTCDTCAQKFYFKCDLKRHQQKIHREGRRYQCLYCSPTSFSTESHQTTHMVKQHGHIRGAPL